MSQRPRILIAQQQRLALNASLQSSIRLLRSDTAGLTRYLEEQAAENPHLRLVQPEAPGLGDWLPRWSGVLAFGSPPPPPQAEVAAAQPSLVAHVMAAIEAMKLPRNGPRIALALVEVMEPSGWLGRTPEAVAQDLGLPEPEVLAVLQKLQRIDPPGLFARNLAECLALQAQDLGQLDAAMKAILRNLDLLAAGDISRLAQLGGCDEAGVARRFRIIRAMNPKPGSDFSGPDPAHIREPDLLARPLKGGRWLVTLNRSALPSLEITETPETPNPEALSNAKSLRHMLRARNDTLLRVGREIAARQVAALTQGRAALAPMTMAEVAEAVGLHVSTISRVVAGASMDSPRGLWWLRRMFSGARGQVDSAGGSGVVGSGVSASDNAPRMAAAALRHRLGQIIATENAEKPYSDQFLSEALAQATGVRLARRTLAQYRDAEGIPPAHRRRRKPIKA